MKGLVFAGGTASRLHPLTLVANKHLLLAASGSSQAKPCSSLPSNSLVTR